MKSFLVKYFKGNSAVRRVLALILVVAVSIGMSSIDASAAKKAKINRKSATLYVGATTQLKLTGTKIKSAKTSKKSVATVTKAGKVTAKKAGSATITLNGTNKKAYKCKVTVINTKINKTAVSLYVGKTYILKLTGTGIKSVKTSDSKIATVTKAGLVTAKKAGTATISLVGKNKLNHKCKVTVKNTTINASSKSLYVNGTYQLKLTGTAIKSVKSSDTAVATVTSTGKVTAVKAGTATITLVGKNNVSHTCKITVIEDVKHEIELTDKSGLQSDGTALIGDQLEVTYGSALGTPKSVTWYIDDKVEEVYTTDGGSMRSSVRIQEASKVGEYHVVIMNTKNEAWTSNKITVVEAEVAGKMSGFTLTEDYEVAADGDTNIVLATTTDKMVATVTLDRDYQGKFYLVDASKSEYKTSDMVDGVEVLNVSNFTENGTSHVMESNTYKTVEKASDMTEAKTLTGDTGDSGTTIVYAFRMNNKDKSVTYRFKVPTLTRGTNYKLIFDQENIEEDTIDSAAPDASANATTAKPNITSAVAAPYVKAPAAIGVTSVAQDIENTEGGVATSKIYQDANKTKVADYIKSLDCNHLSDGVEGGITYYENERYDVTSGTAFNTHQTTFILKGADAGTGLYSASAANKVSVYAKFNAPAGIFGATALELTSAYKVIPTTSAGTLTVSKGTTDRDVKVTIAGQRSAGTVYLLRKTNPTDVDEDDEFDDFEIRSAATSAIDALLETDASTYVAKQNVERTAGSVEFTGVVTDIINTNRNTFGDVYAAVFVPSDDSYAISKTEDHDKVYKLVATAKSLVLASPVAGVKSGSNTLVGTGAITFKDQFGRTMTTPIAAAPFATSPMLGTLDTAGNDVATLGVNESGNVTIAFTEFKTVTLNDSWTLRTAYGTFTLRVTTAGTTSEDGIASTAEFALTFAAN